MQPGDTGYYTFRKAFEASIPVMAGYLVLGAAFGILMADKGFSFWWALLMSTVIYAGSMQFVAVDLLTGGASLISTALVTLLVNARHLFYGISMLDKYRGTGKAAPYLIFSLTDETYALVCSKPPQDVNPKKYDLWISLLDQFYWIAGSLTGSLIGSLLTIDTTGIDFAMTALFVVIFTGQLLETDDYVPACIGVGVSLFCLLIFGASAFLIPSMLGITLLLVLLDLFREQKNKNSLVTEDSENRTAKAGIKKNEEEHR